MRSDNTKTEEETKILIASTTTTLLIINILLRSCELRFCLFVMNICQGRTTDGRIIVCAEETIIVL